MSGKQNRQQRQIEKAVEEALSKRELGHLANPRMFMVSEHQTQYHGPTPPAAEIEKYERILPGAAERIFAMAEREQGHTHTIQKRDLEILCELYRQDSRRADRGLLFGFVIALAGFVVSAFAFWVAQPLAGSIVASLDVAALAAVFIRTRRAAPPGAPDQKAKE